ncbi:nucleotide-binding universal stress UspA family protein [Bradyrhizobium elkanii]|uniref:universal stress protein n=1 Tax=Bradyrhizobium elkanii TaxID=29448 RepID=UPI00351434CA
MLKDIVVFVDPSGKGDEWLRFAATVAARYKARLVGVYVVGDPSPSHGHVRGQGAIQNMIVSFVIREQRKATSTGNRFMEIASQYNAKARFCVVWSDADTNRRIVQHSLLADIVVVGQRRPHGLPEHWSLESLLAASGCPILLVPAGWKEPVAPQRLAIAWNASKEARRAIVDAMPFLLRAHCVTVLAVDQEDDLPGIELLQHLARHGVRANIRHVDSIGTSIGDTILSEASNVHADLIVMGAYSHTKSRRLMFGGVTQTIAKNASIPILMSR